MGAERERERGFRASQDGKTEDPFPSHTLCILCFIVSSGVQVVFFPQRPSVFPLNALEPHPINGQPGHIFVGRFQVFGRLCILMHQLVSQVPLHTVHDAFPGQLRVMEFHALKHQREGNKHTSTSTV